MVKIMENPIKMDDLGVPLFLETPIYIYCSHELSLLNLSMFVAKRQTVLISDTMRMNKRNHQNYTIDLLHEMIH